MQERKQRSLEQTSEMNPNLIYEDWDVNWEEITKRVEVLLINYPTWKGSLELEKELEEAGLSELPPITMMYEEQADKPYSEWHFSSERYEIQKKVRKRNVTVIERAMQYLTHEERTVIETTYFRPGKQSVRQLSSELGFSRPYFRDTRQNALRRLAVFLDGFYLN